ncbi:MAG: hypothetical protein ABJA62_12360 [Luteimonas sp.]
MKTEAAHFIRASHIESGPLPGLDNEFYDIDINGSSLLHFSVVDARSDPETAGICYERKLSCYARFGVAAASVPFAENIGPGQLHLVVATEAASGEIVGGVSIYRRGQASRLPLESTIGSLDAMTSEIAAWQGRIVVELSGLWTEEVWRKTGLSERLMLIAFAAAHAMKVQKIVGFGHHHVRDFYGTVGLVPDTKIGPLAYPSAEYSSSFLYGDPVGLATLPPEKRGMVVAYARAIVERAPMSWMGAERESSVRT